MESVKIVVLGNTYSAFCAFFYLEKYINKTRQSIDLLLVSNSSNYFFKDLVSQVLIDNADGGDIVQNIREVGILRPGVSCLEAEILDINLTSKTIATTKGEVKYNYLILAPEFERENLDKSNVFVLNSLLDAIEIKSAVLKNIKQASTEINNDTKKSLLTVNVIGGKTQGVEIACSLSDYIHNVVRKQFYELNESLIKVNLIEESDCLGENNTPFYNTRLTYNLNKKTITKHLNSKVTDISDFDIEINDEYKIPSGLTIFSGKNKIPELFSKLQLKFDRDCYVCTDLYTKADGFTDVFFIGEISKCQDLSGGVRGNILFYKNQAKISAFNVIAQINNNPLKPLKAPFELDFLSFGNKNSLLVFKDLYFDGFISWLVHRIVYISSMFGVKEKIKSLISLFLNIFGLKEYFILDLKEVDMKETIRSKR